MTDDLIIDCFAGGGGASLGIERAIGRPVDIAINHDGEAIAVHRANHPATEHYCTNIWQVDPAEVVRSHGGKRVGLAWFSPDCKHFSKAKGGRPVKRAIRDLAWVVILWAKRARPKVIMLENVEEFRDWGPLVLNGNGIWTPDPDRKGQTFNHWVGELRRLGYRVEWKELRGCDYGAPTIRKRLFLIARCDGKPIVWPDATHGPGLTRYRTAADIIDWSLPCHSIFLTREEGRAVGVKRPLADATMRRIARGVMRYVIEAKEPFIISVAHGYSGGRREYPIDDPLGTTTSRGVQHGIVIPTLIQTGYGERAGQAPRGPGLEKPLGTAVAAGCKHALVAAFLAQHNTDMVGHDARKPISTIVQKGCTQAVVASHLVSLKGSDRRDGRTDAPCPTITSGGYHVGEVRAFLIKYFGTDQDPRLEQPLHTQTTKDRFGLVTVEIEGESYVIADIGMRMLTPRELFRAQGFPDGYEIAPVCERMVRGKPVETPLPKSSQIRMCGNSVCPPIPEALVRANMLAAEEPAEAIA